MTTTTYLNVRLPEETDAARLEAWFRAYWNTLTDRDLDDAMGGHDGSLDVDGTGASLWLNTKYGVDTVHAVAAGLSGKYPTADVEIIEEWDDDGSGEERTVYVGGVRAVRQERALVPVNLHALIRDVKKALAKRGYERNTNPDVRAAAQALVDALEA